MNTPAHLLFGAAAFGDPGRRGTTVAAILGALAPDVSLYLMAGVALFALNIPPQVVFDDLYFSDRWQQIFAIDNSLILWGIGLGFGVWIKRPWLVAFCGAACLHLLTDLALHHDDARQHFWPVSTWVFESPLSYWDSRFGARWVAPVEGALCLAMLAILWRRYASWSWRAFFTLLMVFESLTSLPFLLMRL